MAANAVANGMKRRLSIELKLLLNKPNCNLLKMIQSIAPDGIAVGHINMRYNFYRDNVSSSQRNKHNYLKIIGVRA